MKRNIALLLFAALISGCATTETPPPAPPEVPVTAATLPVAEPPAEPPRPKPGAENLAKGLEAYENSQYKNSRTLLQSALDGGLETSDQVTAHKYFAFIACASGQREKCKTHFRNALAIDPDFSLGRTEAGHPVWGKAFRDVKAEQQKKKR